MAYVERSQTEIETRIRVPLMHRVTERVTDEITGGICEDERKLISIGNTGFFLTIDTENNSARQAFFDFTPEGKMNASPQTAAKYFSLLCLGLLKTYRFINDEEKLAEMCINSPVDCNLSAFTNARLINSITELFSAHGHGDLIDINPQGTIIDINLSGLRVVPETDPLIVFMEKVKRRAEKLTVTHWLPKH